MRTKFSIGHKAVIETDLISRMVDRVLKKQVWVRGIEVSYNKYSASEHCQYQDMPDGGFNRM
jgi:hypothetical protein